MWLHGQATRGVVSGICRQMHARTALWIVGAACAVAACGPAVQTQPPPAEPEPITRRVIERPASPNGRQVVVGEMCPQGAGGRPAVAPLVQRAVGWTSDTSEVAATVERGQVPRFFVYGVDGKVAGAFDTLGIVEVGIGQPVATGTYVGAAPCTSAGASSTDPRIEDSHCVAASHGCGIAIGELTPPDDPPPTANFKTGGACMAGNELAVDIDGDGRIESFPIAGALDGIRAPAAEWTASASAGGACTPTYQIYGLQLAPESRPGKPAEKGVVTVDVLGVIDLDGDGRRELILAMHFATVRAIVVYAAGSIPERLELVGEATGFAK